MDETQVVGAPLEREVVPTKALLDGADETKVVAVFNPLPQGFRVQYARTLSNIPQMSASEKFAREKAGLDVAKDGGSVGHATQYHVLKAGQTENLPGDIAQIAVRQLVTYLIQKAGKKIRVADPVTRAEFEKQVVVKITDNITFMNQPKSTEEYTKAQIEKLNTPVSDEVVPPPAEKDTKGK